jgi:hypothetical protein
MLAAKIVSIRPPSSSSSPLDLYLLLEIPSLGLCTSSKLSAGLLAPTPHIAKSPGSVSHPHLDRIWTLRRAFALKVTQIIDASVDSGYNHNDELKEFHAGFAPIRKDHASSRKSLQSEADWLCIFGAWESDVCELYPHHSGELIAYCRFTNDLFQANPADPDIVIFFDQHVRLRYDKNPFRLDDRTLTQASLHASLAKANSKRDGPSEPSSGPSIATRAKTIYMNWNRGIYRTSPCENRRVDGVCSECI